MNAILQCGHIISLFQLLQQCYISSNTAKKSKNGSLIEKPLLWLLGRIELPSAKVRELAYQSGEMKHDEGGSQDMHRAI